MNKFKLLKGACLVAATSLLPLSQAAMAEVTISGWINEGIQFWDDGQFSDATQLADNGNTLGSRINFSASSEVATGLTGGIELILEPTVFNASLGFSHNNEAWSDSNNHLGTISLLSNNVWLSGGWGKVTFGTQSLPTDNIAVLEDPSLTLWSSISPVFHGNAFTIRSDTAKGANVGGGIGSVTGFSGSGAIWGNFLGCFTADNLRGIVGIGIDCNGVYRNGIRYDLPAFGPVTIAIGYANDDIYDIAAKWKGNLGRMKGQVALGYAINQGNKHLGSVAAYTTAVIAASTFGDGGLDSADFIYFSESENFQIQAGLMDPETGLFGSIAYQHEEADVTANAQTFCDDNTAAGSHDCALSDDTDAWWIKVGIKKQWFSLGDTSIDFQFGQYDDQYGMVQAGLGVNGSEVERIGVAINQYFGSSLIVYGSWEQLSLDVDCFADGECGVDNTPDTYNSAEDLDTFTIGAVYFF